MFILSFINILKTSSPQFPTLCVLPGHCFAVHKPSIGSLHYFKTQVSAVHTEQGNQKEEFRNLQMSGSNFMTPYFHDSTFQAEQSLRYIFNIKSTRRKQISKLIKKIRFTTKTAGWGRKLFLLRTPVDFILNTDALDYITLFFLYHYCAIRQGCNLPRAARRSVSLHNQTNFFYSRLQILIQKCTVLT